MDTYPELASAIIKQAVKDLKDTISKMDKCQQRIDELKPKAYIGDNSSVCRLDTQYEKLAKLKCERRELVKFFASDWCEGLCGFIGLDNKALKDAINKTGKLTDKHA